MIEDVFGLYKILEVPTDATHEQIKKAYRILALRYHPDKNAHPEAEAKFKAVAAAYNVLSDHTQRQTYNHLRVRNNEVVLDEGPQGDITSDRVFWVGIILGHLISAGAYCVLPFPAILSYFLAPTIGSLAISAVEKLCIEEEHKSDPVTDYKKLGVGMFVSPIVPVAMTADFTFSLYNTVKNFVTNMEIRREYSIISLKLKLEELENDWVMLGYENNNCKQQQALLVPTRRCGNELCEEDDFFVV